MLRLTKLSQFSGVGKLFVRSISSWKPSKPTITSLKATFYDAHRTVVDEQKVYLEGGQSKSESTAKQLAVYQNILFQMFPEDCVDTEKAKVKGGPKGRPKGEPKGKSKGKAKGKSNKKSRRSKKLVVGGSVVAAAAIVGLCRDTEPKESFGVLKHCDGIYIGSMLGDTPHGEGVWTSSDGRQEMRATWERGYTTSIVYKVDNVECARGEREYGDAAFVGTCRVGGQTHHDTKATFKGKFLNWTDRNGIAVGHGELTFDSTGDKYIGKFNNYNKIERRGRIEFGNGNRFEGTFSDSSLQVYTGRMVTKEGKVIDGSWDHGKFTK